MEILFIILAVLALLATAVLITSYVSFRMAFYVKSEDKVSYDKLDVPMGKIYEPYMEQMFKWQKQINEMPHEKVSIRSFDGLKLCGRYYELKKGAPIELMMHGYRGNSQRDLAGGVNRAFSLEHNVLLVDHRGSALSEGNIISFGVNESKDAMLWAKWLEERFGSDIKIILTGVSMGAATAMMCIERGLPPTVKGILADCGYSSQKEIIKIVMKKMKLPVGLLYPFVKLGAKLFGKFDLEEITPLEAVKKSTVPILFAHGDDDRFVPYEMSVECFNACQAKKKLVTIKGAGHGLCYLAAPDEYVKQLSEFFSYLK